MRYDAPVPHATFRYAAEDVEIGGLTIPEGGQVIISLGRREPRRRARFSDAGDVRRRAARQPPPRVRARHPLLPRRAAWRGWRRHRARHTAEPVSRPPSRRASRRPSLGSRRRPRAARSDRAARWCSGRTVSCSGSSPTAAPSATIISTASAASCTTTSNSVRSFFDGLLQHVVRALLRARRLADADPHADEVVGLQVLHDRLEPVVPGEPTADLHPHAADRAGRARRGRSRSAAGRRCCGGARASRRPRPRGSCTSAGTRAPRACPRSSPRRRVTSPSSASATCPRARRGATTTSAPRLCRLRANSSPGLPRPTTRKSAAFPRRSEPPRRNRVGQPSSLPALSADSAAPRRPRPRRLRPLRPRRPHPRSSAGGLGGDERRLGVERRGDARGQREVVHADDVADDHLGDVDRERRRDVAGLRDDREVIERLIDEAVVAQDVGRPRPRGGSAPRPRSPRRG